MSPSTIGELLHVSYANLAMAHAAVASGATSYGQVHFQIRARLLKGLRDGSMNVGSLVEDERLKMVLPQACCYCGGRERLSVDHLVASARGGMDSGDNIVWSCLHCNSSKGARDLLDWYATRGRFPPLLLLRRHLKLAIRYCTDHVLLEVPLADAPDLPFAPQAIPTSFPAPAELVLWSVRLA